MIRKGTTPTHIFNTNVDLTEAVALYVTYKQGVRVVVEKDKSECGVTSTSVTTRLTQADSLNFSEQQGVEIQIRAKFEDGTAIASNIIKTSAERVLKGGEI